jgi:hypothetical protein
MQTKVTNPLFLAAVVLLLRLVAPCASPEVTFITSFSLNYTNGEASTKM